MHPRAYVHACAAAMLPLIGVGGLLGGRDVALGTLLAGLAVLAHLSMGESIVRRFVQAAATQDDPAAVGRLMARQLTTVPLGAVLISMVGALPTGLAYTSLAAGALVVALMSALHSADARSLTVSAEASC